MPVNRPEPPHGALGEFGARTQTSSMGSPRRSAKNVLPPKTEPPTQTERPTKAVRKKR